MDTLLLGLFSYNATFVAAEYCGMTNEPWRHYPENSASVSSYSLKHAVITACPWLSILSPHGLLSLWLVLSYLSASASNGQFTSFNDAKRNQMHISQFTKKSKTSFPRTEKSRFTNHRKNKSSYTLHAKQKCLFTRHEKSIGDPLAEPELMQRQRRRREQRLVKFEFIF